MKTRVLRRGSVKGAYSPSSNHPFYGWHRLKAARIRRAPLIRAAFRGLVKSDAGTLRKEVPASLSPRPPGGLEWNARGGLVKSDVGKQKTGVRTSLFHLSEIKME